MIPHSPTPWRFLEADSHEDEGYRYHSLTICDANNNDLANLYDRDHCNGPSTTREQNVANAHLMASAPRMHHALTHPLLAELIGLLEDGTDDRAWSIAKQWTEFVRDPAIAAAEGR